MLAKVEWWRKAIKFLKRLISKKKLCYIHFTYTYQLSNLKSSTPQVQSILAYTYPSATTSGDVSFLFQYSKIGTGIKKYAITDITVEPIPHSK